MVPSIPAGGSKSGVNPGLYFAAKFLWGLRFIDPCPQFLPFDSRFQRSFTFHGFSTSLYRRQLSICADYEPIFLWGRNALPSTNGGRSSCSSPFPPPRTSFRRKDMSGIK